MPSPKCNTRERSDSVFKLMIYYGFHGTVMELFATNIPPFSPSGEHGDTAAVLPFRGRTKLEHPGKACYMWITAGSQARGSGERIGSRQRGPKGRQGRSSSG